MSGAEWRRLEMGLAQRVKALNLFIKDIYGTREILRADVAQSPESFELAEAPEALAS